MRDTGVTVYENPRFVLCVNRNYAGIVTSMEYQLMHTGKWETIPRDVYFSSPNDVEACRSYIKTILRLGT